MSELLDFNKKTLIPPYEDLTFEVLRSLLVKIVNTLYHHSTIQNSLLTTINEEFKIRPSYSEIIDFIAKRAEPEQLEKTYIDLSIMHNVSSDLERKLEVVSTIHKEQVQDYKHEFKSFQHLAMENFHKLFKKINKHSDERKSVVKLFRKLKLQLMNKKRMMNVFQVWSRIACNKKKSKKKFVNIFKEDSLKRTRKAWNKLKGAYLLTRMKKFEGKSIQALLRADDCQNKLIELLPELYHMKCNKANTEDLVKLEGAVKRINYQSVFTDLTTMIQEEALRIKEEMQSFHKLLERQLRDFDRNVKSVEAAMRDHESFREISKIKAQINSLGNMHLLLNEKVSRIDYCNKKEDSDFKLDVLIKQMQNLESKVLNISNSQDTMQDHTNYLKSILQGNKKGSKGSMRILSSTTTTRVGDSNLAQTPMHGDTELSVSGVYLKPNKRVSSASPGKQRIYHQRRKHNIPTSFSSTLSITETPTHMHNKAV